MRMINIIVSLILLKLFTGCDSGTAPALEEDVLVVQAYLYANQPVEHIYLTQLLPIDVEEGAEAPPVNDAIVALIKNGQFFNLRLSSGDSGYYHYSGTDLAVNAGDKFELSIDYHGQHITAETTVPTAPTSVTISDSIFAVPTFQQIITGAAPPLQELEIFVNWQNTENDLYYVSLENIENNPVEINEGFGGAFKRFMVFPPIPTSEYTITAMNTTHFGTHKIGIFHVNQEYADLYNTQNQDSRDLNEPKTNIVNGLGVFSAIHENTNPLFLEVVAY